MARRPCGDLLADLPTDSPLAPTDCTQLPTTAAQVLANTYTINPVSQRADFGRLSSIKPICYLLHL